MDDKATPSAPRGKLIAVLAFDHVTSSNVIALTAVGFTVTSFWWLNARRGRLKAMRPHAYAFGGSGDRLRLRFPLILFNTGAVAWPVGDLRIVIETDPGKPTLRWVTTRSRLRPGNNDDHAFATPFALGGRDARELIAEFEPSSGLDWSPAANAEYRLRLQAFVHTRRSEKWIDVIAFDWWPPPEEKRGQYLAHRNERT